MSVGAAAVATGLSAVPLAGASWLVRRVRRHRSVSWPLAGLLSAFGAVASVATFFAERALFHWTDMPEQVSLAPRTTALLGVLLFVAPLEEAAKVLAVWPTVAMRRLTGAGLGVTFAVSVASGFAAAETFLYLLDSPLTALRAVRAAAGIPAHAFCAGLWGYALGDRARGGRWFAPAWLGAVAVHALYDHIVFDRGPGLLVAALPMLVAMGFLAFGALRDFSPAPRNKQKLPLHFPEPPSLRAVRRALRSREQPLLLRWIVFGAFVNVGTVIACVAIAALLARRLGVDLALADESDMRSSGPFILLGAAVLVAFPISGFLVARASGAHSVLEPAFAAAAALAGAVALLSLTVPSAVVFALAMAPVAFGLACAGAWVGMDS